MKKNMGTIDRAIRAVVGLAAIAAFGLGAVSGTLSYVVLVVGVMMLGTSAMAYCPPYSLLGINTCGGKSDD